MLFNTSSYEKNPELWLQQQQAAQQKQSQTAQSNQSMPSSTTTNRPVSPNTIYGALLHYHMQQQNHHQELMYQQQLRHENFLITELSNRNLHPNQHLQMIQQAAALAAAQQLSLKTNFVALNKKNDDSDLSHIGTKVKDLNSPALSTSSSSSDTARATSSSSCDDLMSLKIKQSLKRPYLKFSMDSILGNDEKQSPIKRLCNEHSNKETKSELDESGKYRLNYKSLNEQNIENLRMHQKQSMQSTSGNSSSSNGKNNQQAASLNNSNAMFPIGLGKLN